MEIQKKNRTELKAYFLANKIPTQKDFEDLVDAQLNQAEDGIAKVQGNPISLEAEGDPGGPQNVLNFFSDFADANPGWGISLNPRVDPNVPESAKAGFNIKDATGTSRLFIQSAGGNVGLGTIEPSSKLTIEAEEDGSLLSVTSGNNGGVKIFEVKQGQGNGLLNLKASDGKVGARISGANDVPSFFMQKVGIGLHAPQADLHIESGSPEIRLTKNDSGNPPQLSFHHQDGKFWEITSRGGRLDFVPAGNDSKKLRIADDGNLEIRGSGKEDNPDGAMHISSRCILFGGPNASGNVKESCQIAAGKYRSNSMNIVGMSTGTDRRTRKVDIWAEGGLTVRGHVKVDSSFVVAFSASLSADSRGNLNPVTFGQINYNIGNHFKSGKHFTAPVTGIYMFTMTMRNDTEGDIYWRLRLNDSGFINGASGGEVGERTMVRSRLDNHTASRTVITKLNAGDKVHVEQVGGGNDNYSSGFDGVLLVALA